jgi:predicted RNA-binding protein Jag
VIYIIILKNEVLSEYIFLFKKYLLYLQYKLSVMEKEVKSNVEEVGRLMEHSEEKKLKQLFRLYFEGCELAGMPAKEHCSVITFGITNLGFKKFKDRIKMTITLERPGLLIGKAGKTIDGLTAYLTRLSDFPVKIEIKESKLWN